MSKPISEVSDGQQDETALISYDGDVVWFSNLNVGMGKDTALLSFFQASPVFDAENLNGVGSVVRPVGVFATTPLQLIESAALMVRLLTVWSERFAPELTDDILVKLTEAQEKGREDASQPEHDAEQGD